MQNNTKKLITELLINNQITGRVVTDPRNYNKELQVEMSFDDVFVDNNNVALLHDTDNETRAELTGVFKLPLDLIKEAHFTEDFLEYSHLYGQYHVLIYLGLDLDKEVLLTFNTKDRNKSPFILDEEDALAYEYSKEAISKFDYFKGKPVQINLSTNSYQSRYDVDNDNYSDPAFMSLEIKSFDYSSSIVDGIPCVCVTDKQNEHIKLNLNAVSCICRCNSFNADPNDKRIYHVYSEIGQVTILDKGYIYPSESEVA